MHSFTEENYLKAIYKIMESDSRSVSTNAVALKLNTRAASVTDMLKKLSGKRLINYRKYHGVTLTLKGKKVAVNIIRKHRLWELFLVEKLHFRWDEVHEMAEELEHVRSEELTRRMDQYLGYPKFDPHGDPIPDVHGRMMQARSSLLSELKKNDRCIMTGVADHSPVFLNYLDRAGLKLGMALRVNEITDYDKSMSISINRRKKIHMSHEIAKNILVKKK